MKNSVAKNFRTGIDGQSGVLGELEKSVMELLWERGALTGKEIAGALSVKRNLAVTTVLTVLERLVKKGLVAKSKDNGLYQYKAGYSRAEFAEAASREVLTGVVDLWKGSAVASFVDILAKQYPDELDKLSRLIEEKKHAKGQGA